MPFRRHTSLTPREVWRQYACAALLAVILASMFWVFAENVSALLRLRAAAAEGRLDSVGEARVAYSEYWYGRPGPVWVGDDLFELASGEVGFQASSVLAGLIIRDLAGENPTDYVIVPDYAVEQRPRVIISTLSDLTWGTAAGRTYDPVVDDETFERWRESGRVRQFPLGVFALEPQESPARRFILHTDPSGSLIYILPAGESPEALLP